MYMFFRLKEATAITFVHQELVNKIQGSGDQQTTPELLNNVFLTKATPALENTTATALQCYIKMTAVRTGHVL